MSKIKQLNFEGQTIFCGIDVHKKTWNINVRNDEFELESYCQDPCEDNLLNHLRKCCTYVTANDLNEIFCRLLFRFCFYVIIFNR